MELKIFCSWWGIDHLGIEGMLKKVRDAGYDGIEVFAPQTPEDRETLQTQLDELGLELIIHQFRADGEFEEYCENFKKELELAVSLKPLLVNSHTGRDYWSNEQNGKLIEIGLEVESEKGKKMGSTIP